MQSPLIWYYAATVLFLVLDYAVGLNVRIAFLDSLPAARLGYYIVCFFCLALMLWRPRWTVFIGAFESLVTLSALTVSMAVRTMIVTDEMIDTGVGFVTFEEIANYLISGTVAYIAWMKGIFEIRDRKTL